MDTETAQDLQASARRALADMDLPIGQETGMRDPDRTRESRTPNFSRMRLDWRSRDGAMMSNVHGVVQQILFEKFPMAYELMHRLFDIVREPEMVGDGEILLNEFGWTVWKRTSTGAYIEDWSRLTDAEREQLLYRITAYMFEWEQAAADLWGESMFAKAVWEERFAEGFVNSGGKTVDDRSQSGRLISQEERYFALFQSLLSRKAEALVRSMLHLSQRLKDTTLR
jgi:hypothetical protein